MKNRILSALVAFALMLTLVTPAFAYNDVPTTVNYFPAVDYLQQIEALSGGAYFSPNDSINRAAFYKVLILGTGIQKGGLDFDFDDVPKDSWYFDYINTAAQRSLISGREDNAKPAMLVSRFEAIKAATRLMGTLPKQLISPDEFPYQFTDVSYNSAYAPYIKFAIENDLLLESMLGETFQPIKPITRAEAAYLTWKTQLSGMVIKEIKVRIIQTVGFDEDLLESLPSMDIFSDVIRRIRNDFHSPYVSEVDEEALIRAALTALVKELGDPFSSFQEPQTSASFITNLSSSFEGIGIALEQNEEGNVFVSGFLTNSPAEKVGMKTGDVITKVGNVDVTGMAIGDVANLIKGEAGTYVQITVYRERNRASLSFNIERQVIPISYLEADVRGNNIYYFDINLFNESVAFDFANELAELLNNNPYPRGVILDLRNNPGGFLNSSIDIMSHFADSGVTVLKEVKANDETVEIKSSGPATLKNARVVVLIDGGSASASEILALSLKDLQNAYLIGEKTFGKGTVQEFIRYKDGTSLKLTIAEWISPNGTRINNTGVTPDLLVTDDIRTSIDEAISAALNYLR